MNNNNKKTGGATNNHLGNSHWRMLVATNKELYVTLPKRQKQLLSRSIVHAVRSQTPPGRFLQRDPQTDLWYDVGDARATEKTSQALREGAPKLRDKLKKTDDGGGDAAGKSASATATSGNSNKPETKQNSKSKKAAPPVEAPPIIIHPPPTSKAKSVTKVPEDPVETKMAPPVPPQHQKSSSQNEGQRHVASYHHEMPPPRQEPVYSTPIPYEQHMESMPPPPTPLDPAGDFSFGTISVPDAPDMGLENGFSFGSVMSIDPQHQIPPPHQQQQQSHTPHRFSFSRNSATSVNVPQTGWQGHEYSFGSMPMSDAEQRRLEAHLHQQHHPSRIDETHEEVQPVDFGLERGGLSAGSVMSMGTIQTLAGMDQMGSDHNRKAQLVSFGTKTAIPPKKDNQQYHNGHDHEAPPQPVDFGLEHAGFSTGSMMSIGTIKLEDVGTSFGSAMSFATRPADVPDAVGGGLEDIGTSFGSMTLVGGGAPPPPPAAGAAFQPPEPLGAAEPTLLHQQRSRGNLLDCDDSDSEDEQHSAQASLQKSAEWEKLKATFEAQMKSGAYDSAMPPSLYGMKASTSTNESQTHEKHQPILPEAVNRTEGDNDSFGNNMPPPAARKDDDAWKAYEASMLRRGDSLAGEDFDIPRQTEEQIRFRGQR